MGNQRNLVRTLGLGYVVIIVVANIIGSGIYVCLVTQQHNNKAKGGSHWTYAYPGRHTGIFYYEEKEFEKGIIKRYLIPRFSRDAVVRHSWLFYGRSRQGVSFSGALIWVLSQCIHLQLCTPLPLRVRNGPEEQ